MIKTLIGLESENYLHPPVLIGKLVAEAVETEVDVLIVVPEGGHRENAEAIKEQVQEDFADLTLDFIIREGNATDIYREVLNEVEYDLVIVDPNRGPGLRQKTNIEPSIKKKEGLSILLSEYPKPKLENILLATACKEGDHTLVKAGASMARSLKAKLTLLHVISGNVPAMYTGLDQLDETVEKMLRTDTPFAQHLRRGIEILDKHEVDSEVKIRRGVPLEEIVRETQLENYDLVIIGATEVKEGMKVRLMGDLTSRIVDEIKMPVLIVEDRLFGHGNEAD